ncbi:hypothetical protein CEXT_530531 [Caerostris extrusa]|uniref:Uncharacterized protein n=1 Tax=Caerostris extrusa TaxID=172846 RepID=A0AAV4T5S0_CAEEX|nr:hypothetical protein CEXT_530531 [Caerostris extrusa]
MANHLHCQKFNRCLQGGAVCNPTGVNRGPNQKGLFGSDELYRRNTHPTRYIEERFLTYMVADNSAGKVIAETFDYCPGLPFVDLTHSSDPNK